MPATKWHLASKDSNIQDEEELTEVLLDDASR